MNTAKDPKDIIGSIETGIPFPGDTKGRSRGKWKKLYDMKVGESVFVQIIDKLERKSLDGTLSQIRTRYKKRMVSRKWEQDGMTGCRVWRVE